MSREKAGQIAENPFSKKIRPNAIYFSGSTNSFVIRATYGYNVWLSCDGWIFRNAISNAFVTDKFSEVRECVYNDMYTMIVFNMHTTIGPFILSDKEKEKQYNSSFYLVIKSNQDCQCISQLKFIIERAQCQHWHHRNLLKINLQKNFVWISIPRNL